MRAMDHGTPGAPTPFTRLRGLHRSPHAMVAVAVFVYVAITVTLLVTVGSELDRESVFPFAGNPSREATVRSGPTPTNPPDSVLYAIVAMGVVVTAPIVFRRRLFLVALSVSAFAVAVSLVLTILRLGILLIPVVIIQVRAINQVRRRQSAR